MNRGYYDGPPGGEDTDTRIDPGVTAVTLRLLVTGSRAWSDAWKVKEVLDQCEQEAADAGATALIVVHGAAYPAINPETGRRPPTSADWLAHLWTVLQNHTLTVTDEPHPAPWSAPCDPGGWPPCPRDDPDHRRSRKAGKGSYCPGAGHRRNQFMVNAGADHAVAFQYDNSTGTGDCIKRIKEAGIDLTEIVQHREKVRRGRT
jgi:hypothetical protein